MKKVKIVFTLLITIIMIFSLTTVVSAEEGDNPEAGEGVAIGEITIKPDMGNADSISGVGNDILGLIQIVGTIIAVAMVLVLGIKYMMGSAEEKAANKKSMMPYLIGAILLFIGSNVVKIIYTWASGLNIS